jgi:dTDP-4-amino-4,6-dideoxygalactose transaminase
VVLVEGRDEVRKAMARHGVDTGIHYAHAVHQNPAYNDLGAGRDLRNAESLAATVLSLPISPHLSNADQHVVIKALLATTHELRVAT